MINGPRKFHLYPSWHAAKSIERLSICPLSMADPFDYVSVADATRRFAELVGNDKKLTAAVKHTMETLNNE